MEAWRRCFSHFKLRLFGKTNLSRGHLPEDPKLIETLNEDFMIQTKLLILPALTLCFFKPELSSAVAIFSISALSIAEIWFDARSVKLSDALETRIASLEAQLTRVSLR